jgi:hypothetical protein
MLATQGRSASTAIGGTAELAFGAATSSTERGATWFEDTDNLSPSDNGRETLSTRIIQWRDRTGTDTFTLRGSADFASFLSNGFRVSWSNVETSGRQIIYVAFGAENNYELDLEAQWANVNYNGTIKELRIYANSNATENLRVDVWHGGSWNNLLTNLVNGWNNVSVSAYLDSSTFTIRFKGSNEISDTTQDSWRIDATMLYVWPPQNLYAYLQNATIVTELLQNGTMRWLGQNLQLTTQSKPIPPIPVRTIRVNQTINGVNRQVPFQIEDWASDYKIPLGLTGNTSVFSGRNMIVFLMTPRVSKVTIWWDGRDNVNQTSYAYRDIYFTGDNPSSRLLTNGILRLQFSGEFTLTSTLVVSGTTCTSTFMRINSEASTYGATEAYVIYNGVVRDIVHQEAEWSNGADNCPNLYAHIVLTLPANATYYTYQLRLMFITSQQSRTINDICPIRLTASSGTFSSRTENGTSSGYPIVSTATGLFYNRTNIWQHHWSQLNSTATRGFGIMFTDEENRMLYTFDNSTIRTGALSADSSARTIELRPVSSRGTVSFKYSKDVMWNGAAVMFNGTPIYQVSGGKQTGLWVTVEYPPTITVITES